MKKKKNIWTPEGPRRKKDKHMKAHIYKKMMIAISQKKRLKRDPIYKRSIVLVHLILLVHLFPHTCTS
jgi:hypothetical protein